MAASHFRSSVPEPVRFVTSGSAGSGVFYLLNEAVLGSLPPDLPSAITIAWFVSYLVSIWLQHLLHVTLVYGWDTPYWQGLIACYTGYSGALMASVPINAGLVSYFRLNAGEAWLATLTVTGVANYFVLGKLMGPAKTVAGKPKKGTSN